jgi:hypothetical protein
MKLTLIGSMMADRNIKKLVTQLQRHKLMTDAGQPVTFEIEDGILDVWYETWAACDPTTVKPMLRIVWDSDRAEAETSKPS